MKRLDHEAKALCLRPFLVTSLPVQLLLIRTTHAAHLRVLFTVAFTKAFKRRIGFVEQDE